MDLKDFDPDLLVNWSDGRSLSNSGSGAGGTDPQPASSALADLLFDPGPDHGPDHHRGYQHPLSVLPDSPSRHRHDHQLLDPSIMAAATAAALAVADGRGGPGRDGDGEGDSGPPGRSASVDSSNPLHWPTFPDPLASYPAAPAVAEQQQRQVPFAQAYADALGQQGRQTSGGQAPALTGAGLTLGGSDHARAPQAAANANGHLAGSNAQPQHGSQQQPQRVLQPQHRQVPSAAAQQAGINAVAGRYFLNPLAMTSMSSCPPYGAAAGGGQAQGPGAGPAQGAAGTGQVAPSNPAGNSHAGAAGAAGGAPSAFPVNHLDHLSDLASNFANSGGLAAAAGGGHHHHRGLSASGLTINLAGGPTGGLNLGQARGGPAGRSSAAPQSGVQGRPGAPGGHYGVTVNGFHPQVNARVNPVVGAGLSAVPPASRLGPPSLPPGASLVRSHARPAVVSSVASSRGGQSASGGGGGGGSSHARGSQERNQREAERAQKITRLITDIRVSMEEGGWKEEMKSKYQTLSQCKEYLAQLQKSLKAKEAEVAETRRIAEECRANGHDTSVASSLTDLTPRSGGAPERSDGESITSRSDSSNSNGSKGADNGKRKRKSVDFRPTEGGGGGKRAKQVTSSGTADSSSTSGDENDATPDGRNITFGKEQSSISMSDMTDSNKDSSEDASAGDGKGGDPPGAESTAAAAGRDDEDNQNLDSISSISSTAAVVRGLGGGSQNSPKTRSSGRRQRAQGDRQDDPQQQPREKLPPIDEGCNANDGAPAAAAGQSSEEDGDRPTSAAGADVGGGDGGGDAAVPPVPPPHAKKKKRPRSSTFHLDYREVFHKSNVPQLVASLNGRVVTWNDFLLSATGMSPREAGNLTVFGMVESDQLSDLYAMVSKALAYRPGGAGRSSPPPGGGGGSAPGGDAPRTTVGGDGGSGEGAEPTWRSITLRCAPFRSPARAVVLPAASDGGGKRRTAPGALYMNITLIGDEDPGKRCFHCVLTDKPGEDGRVGGVTPGLFDLIGRAAREKR